MSQKYLGKTCPYCKTPLVETDAVAVCGVCDMPHHLSCWQDNRGCTTFGCTGTIREVIGHTSGAVAQPAASQPQTQQTRTERSEKPVEILYEVKDTVFMADVPLVLENTALIIDRKQEKLFARCSFRCLTDKAIKAVMIQITCQDVWGSTLGEPIAHQYLDLKTKRDATFGQTNPIELADKTARQIQVSVQKVLFEDHTVLTGGGVAFTMAAPVLLSEHLGSEALAQEYARETTPKARFLTQSANGYWRCTCGALNTEAEVACHSCGSTQQQLTAALDKETLNANMIAFTEAKRVAEEKARAEQAERIRQAEEAVALEQKQQQERIEAQQKEEKRKKIRKRVTVASIVSVVTVAALVCALVFFVIPYMGYQAACDLLNDEQYSAAHQAFVDLGGFMDSEEMALESLYQKGMSELEGKYFVAANQTFINLGDYKDSPDMALEAFYLKALDDVATKNFNLAILTFKDLGDYKDSADQLVETKYLWAEYSSTQKDYKKAYQLFKELGDYKDSKQKVLTTIMLWESASFLDMWSADDLVRTVKLDSSHYEMYYNTIMLFISAHTNATEWYDWGSKEYSRNTKELLTLLPSTYKDVAILKNLFDLLTDYRPYPYEGLFSENASLMWSCWPIDFIQDLAEDDDAISDFLVGNWYGSGYYFKVDKDHHSSYDLPWVAKPAGAKYYDIENMIYYYDDDDSNHLAKVFRFEIVDYDTIRVYCYKNGYTYTLYRN